MNDDAALSFLADLAEFTTIDPNWEELLRARPELAHEIEIARKMRGLLVELRTAEIALPAGFEARLFARLRADTSLLPLLDLSLAGFGRVLLELLDLIFGILPQPAKI